MRSFIAITLPPEVKEQLHELMHPIGGIRWQDYNRLHITLKFLGETEQERADELIKKLDTVRPPVFTFSIKGLGYFPEGKQPRVLWAGIENGSAVENLQQKIEAVCMEAGFEPESRPFRPHITIGKVKDAPGAEVRSYIERHESLHITGIPVERYILFESRPGRDGATHIPYARFPLKDTTTAKNNGDEAD